MNKIEIINSILNGKRISKSLIKKYDIYNEIMLFTKDLDIKFPFRVWHYLNNEPNYILCECGNKVSNHMNWKDGYKQFCSNKCSSNSEITKNKLKETLMNKYGVDHYSKTDEFKTKYKETSVERYGVTNYSKTEEYLEKSKKTYISKYGDHFTRTDEYKKKTIETNNIKYNKDYPIQSEAIKEKILKTNLDRYGEPHIFLNDNYRKSNFKISNDPNYLRYENNLNIFSCGDHEFSISTDDYYGRISNNIKLCTICNPIGELKSIKEKELFEFISEIYDKSIIRNYRIENKEIDIYIPDLNIGFEFNGSYWHSEKFKDKNYHINKTIFFESKNIKIIHIWENDWVFKNDIIKLNIKNLLNPSNLYDFIIKEVHDVSKFLNGNHLYGNDISSIKIGLYHNDEIVSVITFNTIKSSENEYLLSRFCDLLNIKNSFGVLLNYFIENYKPNKIISYVDDPDIYLENGFNIIERTEPNYVYYRNLKIWDSGKLKMEKTF